MNEFMKQYISGLFIYKFIVFQIRVNTVNPTAVRTPMLEKAGVFDEGNEFGKSILSRTPLRRIAGKKKVYPKWKTKYAQYYEHSLNVTPPFYNM